MSVHWGYYCRTCDENSRCWVDDPRILREIYLSSEEKLDQIWANQRVTIQRREVQPILFLAKHFGHELWVGNEYAGLKLPDQSAGIWF